MDIRVGEAPSIGAPADRAAVPGGTVEARILAIRPPRRRAVGPPDEKAEQRSSKRERDPVNSRVLVVLVPDAGSLPEGLEAGTHRVFLRFARR